MHTFHFQFSTRGGTITSSTKAITVNDPATAVTKFGEWLKTRLPAKMPGYEVDYVCYRGIDHTGHMNIDF